MLGTQNSFIGVSILRSIMAFHYYAIKTLKLQLVKMCTQDLPEVMKSHYICLRFWGFLKDCILEDFWYSVSLHMSFLATFLTTVDLMPLDPFT